MIFLWTRSKMIGSKAICWGLDSDCSHFAMAFDTDPSGYGIVLHSSLTGVQLVWYKDFIESHEIIHSLIPSPVLTLQEEEQIYQAVISKFHGQSYDYRAIVYWTYRVILKKCFGTPFPDKNLLSSDSQPLCTGMASAIVDELVDILKVPSCIKDIKDFDMVSPHMLYNYMKRSPKLYEQPSDLDI